MLYFALFFFYVLDLVYSSFRSGIYFSFSLTPNRRWTGASPTNPKILWMIQKKIYRQRRREARSRKPELVDPKVEADGSSSSPQATPPTSPKEAPLHQGMALPEQGAKLGVLEERVHDGVLLAGQDPNFTQQDCYIRASPDVDYCGSL